MKNVTVMVLVTGLLVGCGGDSTPEPEWVMSVDESGITKYQYVDYQGELVIQPELAIEDEWSLNDMNEVATEESLELRDGDGYIRVATYMSNSDMNMQTSMSLRHSGWFFDGQDYTNYFGLDYSSYKRLANVGQNFSMSVDTSGNVNVNLPDSVHCYGYHPTDRLECRKQVGNYNIPYGFMTADAVKAFYEDKEEALKADWVYKFNQYMNEY